MNLSPDNTTTCGTSATWGCFIASIFLLFYHEKVFFNESFKTGVEYGLILGLTLGGFLLMAIAGAKLPAKILVGLLWGVLLTTAVLWVLIGAALPLEPSNIGCSDPVCGIPGQLALVTLELGITPPLLLEYFRRSRHSLSQSTGISAGMYAGLGLLAAGLISLAGYYWTYLAHVSLLILAAVGVLSMSLRKVPAQENAAEGNLGVSLYVGQFFRDFAMLAFTGVFGFSILERDAYSYELLISFGIGLLAFAIVLHYGAQFWGEPRATRFIEGMSTGIFTLLTGFALYMLFTIETVVLPISIPPWLVGFAVGYLWHRLDLLVSGTRMRIANRKLHFQKVPIHFIRKLVSMLFLTGTFLLTVINIDPEGTESVLILDIGFVIGAAYFLIWIIMLYKNRSRETKSNSNNLSR